MEEKKIDFNQIIGFVLIFGILMWIMNQNATQQKIDAEKAKQEQLIKSKQQNAAKQLVINQKALLPTEKAANDKAVLGKFAYSAALASANDNLTVIENDLIVLTVANKGGQIVNAKLKNFEKFKKKSGDFVTLIKNNNASLNLKLETQDNRILDTKNLYFEPQISKNNESSTLIMRLKTNETSFLEYKYVLKNNDYMIDFDIRSEGLKNTINTSKPIEMEWSMKTFRNEKSITYENSYTDLRYRADGKKNDLGLGNNETETLSQVSYFAFKQHFFSSILLSDKTFAKAQLFSDNLVKDAKIDTVFTKQFRAIVPLTLASGEISQKMNWYFGPTDYSILKSYQKNIEEIVPLGWGIFGWMNRYVFIPMYGFISQFISHGWAIILFTILVKLLMSPVTYKSFLSQAKMKVLRPEITELGEKFKKDPMKKQQETMKLYSKAGVNPMAGCIPALIQMPVFYALFQFFPSAIDLRQQGFLWADDLSSFDSILKLPFNIPLYGDHVSLFSLLASIAIFFYMKMTSGDQQMQAPQQEGMPDMAKMMKIMIYVSPFMMLIFFNNYGAGLSLYNFISNLITIGIMLVIKNYIVDNDKIHAQIQENKLKTPKKQGKFQQKMQELMEQAEAQKAAKAKK